ncbi:MAG: KH domain-containing protein [Acidimicrobiales bacterium]
MSDLDQNDEFDDDADDDDLDDQGNVDMNDDDDDADDIDGNRSDDDGDANLEIAPTAVAVMEYLARSVVEDADAVHVVATPIRGRKVRLSVHAAPNDFGRLIGRRGRVATALRTVVGAAAAKDGYDAEVEFVE